MSTFKGRCVQSWKDAVDLNACCQKGDEVFVCLFVFSLNLCFKLESQVTELCHLKAGGVFLI